MSTASIPSSRSTSSRPIVPLPAITRSSLDRVDEHALDAGVRPLLQRLPPAIERHLNHVAAKPLDRCDLRPWRVVGRDDRRGDAELPRHPRDALRHVPGAGRPYAFGDRLDRRLPDRVCRPADLERADRLQALELEPDLRVGHVDLQADERRLDRGACDHLAGAADLRKRDQSWTSVPMPRSRARATQISAAARSSTAIPSDLNTVNSSLLRRPG